jgi:hypothetical protein
MTKREANIEADFAQDPFEEAVEVLEAAGDDLLAMDVPYEAINALCNAQYNVCVELARDPKRRLQLRTDTPSGWLH